MAARGGREASTEGGADLVCRRSKIREDARGCENRRLLIVTRPMVIDMVTDFFVTLCYTLLHLRSNANNVTPPGYLRRSAPKESCKDLHGGE